MSVYDHVALTCLIIIMLKYFELDTSEEGEATMPMSAMRWARLFTQVNNHVKDDLVSDSQFVDSWADQSQGEAVQSRCLPCTELLKYLRKVILWINSRTMNNV